MGTVYEAEEIATGRRVAIKLIRQEFADSPDTVERFRREGRLASTLFHPRCVFVLAADEEAGRPYIVMELMPGRNLDDLVRQQGPLPVAEAVAKILDVIEGLQEAHRLGVIHRDVKPSNCFLDEDERVKVGDFGLAKSLVGPEHLTRSGSFLGTILFASPEQIRNEPVNHQTDVYSVCATLYYLLTGRAPFQDDDPAAALAKTVSDPTTSMRKWRKDVPRTLDEVVLCGLTRQRGRRWQNLDELRLALLPFVEGPHSIAEMGWRCSAYLFDLVLLIPLELLVRKLLQTIFPAIQGEATALFVSLGISLGCGVLYFAIPEWLAGCSLGKFLVRLRVRDAITGDRPSLPRALLRTFLFYLFKDSIALLAAFVFLFLSRQLFVETEVSVIARIVGSVILVAFLPFLSGGIGMAILASTMRRRNGYRGIHELFSGTRVIRIPTQKPRFVAPAHARWPEKSRLPADIPERIGGFSVHAVAWSDASERVLQGEDTVLHRPVWLWQRRGEVTALPASRREVARDARARWLASGIQDDWHWEAFVAAPGVPLTELVNPRHRLIWTDALAILEQLTIELEEAEQDGSLPDRLSPEQVWVQSTGRIFLLDSPPRSPTVCATPWELLRQVAAVTLEGLTRHEKDQREPIRAPIPGHARVLLTRLMGTQASFLSLLELRQALAEAHERPEEISRPGRALQVALSMTGAAPGLWFMFGLAPTLLMLAYLVCVLGAATGEFRREQLDECLTTVEQGKPDTDPQRRLHETELADIDERMAALERDRKIVLASWSWFMVDQLKRNQFEDRFRKEYINRRLQDPDNSTSAEGEARGLDSLVAHDDDLLAGPSTLARAMLRDWWLIECMLFWPLVWALWAALTRGGLSLRLAGISLVDEHGRPAPRWRCGYRALVVWLPLAIILFVSLWLDVWRVAQAREGWSPEEVRLAGWVSWHLWWGSLALLSAYVFSAICWPNRGLHDRIAGLYPVPR
jgi:hypothetical protein